MTAKKAALALGSGALIGLLIAGAGWVAVLITCAIATLAIVAGWWSDEVKVHRRGGDAQ